MKLEEKIKGLSPSNSLVIIKESLNVTLDEAVNYYKENIGNISDFEKSKARLKLASKNLSVAGYIDEDGATIAPASWREN